MLIQVNEYMVINPDLIVAARREAGGANDRWRVVVAGQATDSPQIFLTTDEMRFILDGVAVPQMAALLRLAGIDPTRTQTPGELQ